MYNATGDNINVSLRKEHSDFGTDYVPTESLGGL